MPDNKLTKSIGEHWVCSVLAGYGWAVALTRDAIERTDILATHTTLNLAIEVQVKTASHSTRPSWLVGLKGQLPARSDREWFVFVALGPTPESAHQAYVLPRDHASAAAWVNHMDWLSSPDAKPGTRNTPVALARLPALRLARYENRWDLMLQPATAVPVLLPVEFRNFAKEDRVGLPPEHPWHKHLPKWG